MNGSGGSLVAALTRAVDLAPEDVELRLHLAKVLISVGRNREAVAHLGVVLSINPSEPRARQMMLECLAPEPVTDPRASMPKPAVVEPAPQIPGRTEPVQLKHVQPVVSATEPVKAASVQEESVQEELVQEESVQEEVLPRVPAQLADDEHENHRDFGHEDETAGAEEGGDTSLNADDFRMPAIGENSGNGMASGETLVMEGGDRSVADGGAAYEGALAESVGEEGVADEGVVGSSAVELTGADQFPTEFDWAGAEAQIEGTIGPRFIDQEDMVMSPGSAVSVKRSPDPRLERPAIRLADVGGMAEVKKRIEQSFLLPLRNQRLSKLFAKTLRGGLLLYGAPGVGKTYLARAIAGELEANFYSVSLADVLDPTFGGSERNIVELFKFVRRYAPCVLFFDEIDALGRKRSSMSNDLFRGVLNQMLTELDGVRGDNDGVFVLAATNQPWDVDPALRRPGRLDRTVFVAPPDAEARKEIFRLHLQERPIENIDLIALARATEGYSGADIAFVCEVAAELALSSSIASDEVRMIHMGDLRKALADVVPSTVAWFESARNFVTYAPEEPAFAELRHYLKRTRRL